MGQREAAQMIGSGKLVPSELLHTKNQPYINYSSNGGSMPSVVVLQINLNATTEALIELISKDQQLAKKSH